MSVFCTTATRSLNQPPRCVQHTMIISSCPKPNNLRCPMPMVHYQQPCVWLGHYFAVWSTAVWVVNLNDFLWPKYWYGDDHRRCSDHSFPSHHPNQQQPAISNSFFVSSFSSSSSLFNFGSQRDHAEMVTTVRRLTESFVSTATNRK